MVKRSRFQSSEQPSLRSCSVMREPDSAFQAQTRRRNSSRPRSCRVLFSVRLSWRSTTSWVAIPA
jgi:hypothetical protein